MSWSWWRLSSPSPSPTASTRLLSGLFSTHKPTKKECEDKVKWRCTSPLLSYPIHTQTSAEQNVIQFLDFWLPFPSLPAIFSLPTKNLPSLSLFCNLTCETASSWHPRLPRLGGYINTWALWVLVDFLRRVWQGKGGGCGKGRGRGIWGRGKSENGEGAWCGAVGVFLEK